MSRARRGVAAAVATPLSVVVIHALATLQGAWLGPTAGGAAGALVLPIVAAGLVSLASGAGWLVVGAAALVAAGLGAVGMLPWAFVPLSLLSGFIVAFASWRVARALPPSLDDAWERVRGKCVAWCVLAIVMVLQVSRLSAFMTDSDNVWGSTFPPIEFTVGHMCMGSYIHAADLTRQDAGNIYSPDHYPVFGEIEAEHIETSIEGLQEYFEDAFLYAPPFLLLPRAWIGVSNDYRNIRSVWFAVQLLAFVAAAVLVARWVGGSTGAWSLWLLPLLLASMPTMFNFQFGQAHVLTVWTALLAMIAFEEKRSALGGALLAWGIASKIFPGVLGLYLLFQKRWIDLAWTAAFTGVLAALSVVVIGTGPAAQFTEYMLPRLASGDAFSFVTDELPIVTNFSVPGTVWKLDFFGIEDGNAWLGVASLAYTVLLILAIWVAARLDIDHARLAQVWLALLILASLRSPIVPIYGLVPVLWLMTLELDRVRTTWGVVGFAASWVLIDGLPPAPDPRVTIGMVAIAQLAILYWVIRPLRSPSAPPLPHG